MRGVITEQELLDAQAAAKAASSGQPEKSAAIYPENSTVKVQTSKSGITANCPLLVLDNPSSTPGATVNLLRAMQDQPPDVDGSQGMTYAQRAMQAAQTPVQVPRAQGQGGVAVRGRGGKALVSLLLLSFCAGGASAPFEHGNGDVVQAVVAASYVRSSIYAGLPDEVVPQVEQIMDNRLATSSWQKLTTALKSWRAFAALHGWETIIRTDDPNRGGKLAAWVTSLIALTTLVYASISKYVWGLCTWMQLQHQADPRVGVPEWRTFMAAAKVLTFVPAKPHDRCPVERLELILHDLDSSKFEDVQLATLLLMMFYTFARSETPLSKNRSGRDCFDPKEDLTWGDVRLRRDQATGWEQVTEVRFKKTKTDQRVERPEARGGGDWVTIGQTDEEVWSLAYWYIKLLSFHGRPRRADEPFFVDVRRYPDGTARASAVDAGGAWLYRDALAAFHAAQSAVGVPDGELASFHGLRVEGYGVSKRANGEDLTVAHGGWKSRAGHERYDRFKARAVRAIPRNMRRACLADFSGGSSEDGTGSAGGSDEEPPERAAGPPAERLQRHHVGSPSAGSQASPAGSASAPAAASPRHGSAHDPLLPEGWKAIRRQASSGVRYTTYKGPDGQTAGSRDAAWRVAEGDSRERVSKGRKGPKTPTATATRSGPVPRGVELGEFVVAADRPPTRKPPAQRKKG